MPSVVNVRLSRPERAVLERIQVVGGFVSPEETVRYTILRAALFLEIDMPAEAFALGYRSGMRALLAAEKVARRR